MSTRGPPAALAVFHVGVLLDTDAARLAGDSSAQAAPDAHSGGATAAACARLPRRTVLWRASDERLAELAREGDQRAFEVLVERYRPLLLRHCRSVAKDGAHDALQQALTSAWLALRGGALVLDMRAWLFTIAHRAALRVLRERGALGEQLPERLAGGRSPEEHSEQSARVRAALAAIAGLPSRERDALVWTSIQGHSGRDAARALGVTEEALRQLVFRARARARAAIGAFVPWLLPTRLPGNAAHVCRRVSEAAQRAWSGASAIDPGDTLARLCPLIAAGALVGAPVVAVELSNRPGAGATRRQAATARQVRFAGSVQPLRPHVGRRARNVAAPPAAPRALHAHEPPASPQARTLTSFSASAGAGPGSAATQPAITAGSGTLTGQNASADGPGAGAPAVAAIPSAPPAGAATGGLPPPATVQTTGAAVTAGAGAPVHTALERAEALVPSSSGLVAASAGASSR